MSRSFRSAQGYPADITFHHRGDAVNGKLIARLAAIVLGVGLIAGCGSSSGTGSESASMTGGQSASTAVGSEGYMTESQLSDAYYRWFVKRISNDPQLSATVASLKVSCILHNSVAGVDYASCDSYLITHNGVSVHLTQNVIVTGPGHWATTGPMAKGQ